MKKTAMIVTLVMVSLIFTTTAYSAGKVNNFYVTYVRVDRSGFGIVKFDRVLVGTPASCISGGHTSHLSFNTNTQGGKAIYALVLTAHLEDKSVRARGTGLCSEYGVVESWSYGWINE